MIVVRKGLDAVFTKRELQVLDDILPAFKRHDRLDDEEALHTETQEEERRSSINLRYTQSAVEVDMASGKVMRIPNTAIRQPEINITEEINNCGGWKSVEKKNEDQLETKNISKDSSPDDGIVIKVEKQNNKLEAGNDEEKK